MIRLLVLENILYVFFFLRNTLNYHLIIIESNENSKMSTQIAEIIILGVKCG